jgi:hypothetical protein
MDNLTSRFTLWIGSLLILPSLFMWVLWIRSFNAGTNQADRVAIYLSHFPAGIPLGLLIGVGLVTSISAIVFGVTALKKSTLVLRIINIVVVIVGSVLTLLNVFQLM